MRSSDISIVVRDDTMNSVKQDDDSLEEKMDTDDEANAGDSEINDVTDILKRYEHLVDTSVMSEAVQNDSSHEREEEPAAKEVDPTVVGNKDAKGGQQQLKDSDDINETESPASNSESPKQKSNLKKCNQCDFTTKNSSYLKKHIDSKHTGISFPCSQCEYRATTKGNLKLHIQAKHDKIRYPCSFCDHQASLKGNLKAHIKKMHTSDPQLKDRVKNEKCEGLKSGLKEMKNVSEEALNPNESKQRNTFNAFQ